jgi:hypothetical protein
MKISVNALRYKSSDLRSITPKTGALLMDMRLPTTSQYLNGAK